MPSQFFRSVAFFLDIDGTIDICKGKIYEPINDILAHWLSLGGHVVFITNRPLQWVIDRVASRVACYLRSNPEGRLFVAAEQGAAIHEVMMRPKKVIGAPIMYCRPFIYQEEVRSALTAAVASGKLQGRLRDGNDHQVCFECDEKFDDNPMLLLPPRVAAATRLRETRTTYSFVSAGVGKDVAARFLLQEVDDLRKCEIRLGFADDGDEFASVVPVLDVDRNRRGTFEKDGYQAADIEDPAALNKLGIPIGEKLDVNPDELRPRGGVATAAVLKWLLSALLTPKTRPAPDP